MCFGCVEEKNFYDVIQITFLSWSNVTQNRSFLTIVARLEDSGAYYDCRIVVLAGVSM